MNWFRHNQNKDLEKLLKDSDAAFRFDPTTAKFRLLASIEALDQKPSHQFRFARIMRYSFGFAGLVLAMSATFAFASSAKPGDALFSLNKFRENFMLTLPLSEEAHANIQANIVTNRLEALDQVEANISNTTAIETVRESDETLNTAVADITKKKQSLDAAGKTNAAKKLEMILDHLQTMAKKREAAIAKIETTVTDEATRKNLEDHLQKIQSSREKARLEIKQFKPSDENETSE